MGKIIPQKNSACKKTLFFYVATENYLLLLMAD